ncbi:MAG TPA: sugar MFS transporter, partial [Polyangia bacterium]
MPNRTAPAPKNNYAVSVVIIGVLFFNFGFVTWMNGTLIPFLKLACNLQSDSQALLVTFAFYMAYFFLALPSSYILNWVGYRKGISIGLAVMAVGALIFIPAAQARSFTLFLVGLFVQATGMALQQTAVNPYISVWGPIDSAARRIALMGIFNKVAGAVSPIILGAIVLKGASDVEAKIAAATDPAAKAALLDALAGRVIAPYLIMTAVLVLLALAILKAPLPEIEPPEDPAKAGGGAGEKTSVLQFPHLVLGVLCIFVYVGAEVMAGDVIGTYGNAIGMSLDQTKNFTSYTLWSMVVGYILGIVAIPKYISQTNALKVSAVLGLLFTTLAFVTSGATSILFVALLGLANALMWPAIFPLAIDGLGRFTQRGAALLIMGISGGAAIPQIYAKLAEGMAANAAFFWCTLPCYVYILYYAVAGARVGRDAVAVRRTE